MTRDEAMKAFVGSGGVLLARSVLAEAVKALLAEIWSCVIVP
jgi:hypothetical protein